MESKELLVRKLKEHLKLEQGEVASYIASLNRARNPVLGILYKGFLDDSKRHADILRAVISYLTDREKSSSTFVGHLQDLDLADSVDPAMEERLEALVKEERKMIQDPYIDLLLESIVIDEQKHAKLGRSLVKLLSPERRR